MTPVTASCDFALFGGGIAGLMLLNQLRRQGFSCFLFEKDELGKQQTLHSQGIIHGGMKYALTGTLSEETEAIAGMPTVWRQYLSGEGEIDLRGVQVLSDTQYMWSTGNLASRFSTFFASKLLRGRIDPLDRPQFPSAFQHPKFKGVVYRLDDIVLDIPQVLQALIRGHEQSLVHLRDPASLQITRDEHGSLIRFADDGKLFEIRPQRVILCAGAGNEALLKNAGRSAPQMQLRPLHMVAVKHRLKHVLCAHCIGTSPRPRITITTHSTDDGAQIWYLGGDIAETGVDRDTAAQIAAAQFELSTLFPWLDFSDAEFATLRIDRAEPKQSSLLKPDTAFLQCDEDIWTAWPTKLTLAPSLCTQVLHSIHEQNIKHKVEQIPLPGTVAPRLAPPFWKALFS